jgi:hypothetical protein
MFGNEMETQIKGSNAKRRGRPPKAGESKRTNFNTRLRNSLRVQLEGEALAAGRSLSEEIEARLERSFADETIEPALGRQGRAFLRLLVRVLRHAPVICGLSSEEDWLDDPTARDMALRELVYVAEALKPHGDPSHETARHAEIQAQRTLLALGDESPNEPWSRWAAAMRADLGPAMAGRAIAWRKKFIDSNSE